MALISQRSVLKHFKTLVSILITSMHFMSLMSFPQFPIPSGPIHQSNTIPVYPSNSPIPLYPTHPIHPFTHPIPYNTSLGVKIWADCPRWPPPVARQPKEDYISLIRLPPPITQIESRATFRNPRPSKLIFVSVRHEPSPGLGD